VLMSTSQSGGAGARPSTERTTWGQAGWAGVGIRRRGRAHGPGIGGMEGAGSGVGSNFFCEVRGNAMGTRGKTRAAV
jgi:hypothetical protein